MARRKTKTARIYEIAEEILEQHSTVMRYAQFCQSIWEQAPSLKLGVVKAIIWKAPTEDSRPPVPAT